VVVTAASRGPMSTPARRKKVVNGRLRISVTLFPRMFAPPAVREVNGRAQGLPKVDAFGS